MNFSFFFQAEDGIRALYVTGVQTCALPILPGRSRWGMRCFSAPARTCRCSSFTTGSCRRSRSEEHTSELQSRRDLVCRLLLEKKKNAEISELVGLWDQGVQRAELLTANACR